MNHNFLITAMGGSGTTFLSSLLNQSPTWTVAHEPEPRLMPPSRYDVAFIRERFLRDCYGEVNGWLRTCADQLPLDRLGVILRRPSDLLWSWSEHYGPDWEPTMYWWFEAGFEAIDRLASMHGVSRFYFDQMFDIDYLQGIASWAGINDLYIERETIGVKLNAKRVGKYNSFLETPVAYLWDLIKDFEEKWWP